MANSFSNKLLTAADEEFLHQANIRAIKCKHLAFVQYKSNPSAYTFRVYREESNKLSNLMKNSRRKYEKHLALKAMT